MDPYAVLEVDPRASSDAVTAAYRRLAKRWHPDRARGPEAERRMAEINAAYAALRDRIVGGAATPPPAARPAPAPRARGHWLPERLRQTLGPELLQVLRDGEDVTFAVHAAGTLVAVSDSRVLWLDDEAVLGRVNWLRLAEISGVRERSAWSRGRTATVAVTLRSGRRHAFRHLPLASAQALARALRAALEAPAPARSPGR